MITLSTAQSGVILERAATVVPRTLEFEVVSSSLAHTGLEKQVDILGYRRSSRIANSQRSNIAVSGSLKEVVQRLKIRGAEAEKLLQICSLEDLRIFVTFENQGHQQRIDNTGGGKFQTSLLRIDEFGKAYAPILSAFKEALPNGGGHAVWALLGGLFLVAQRKDRREKSISEFLSRLNHCLPRNNCYRELYQNSSVIVGLHEQLQIAVINALIQAYDYFRGRDWTGTLRRISSAMGIHDVMVDSFDEVAKISTEIDSESMLELRVEVREAHEVSSQIKVEAERTNIHLLDVKKQLMWTSEQLNLVNNQLETAKQLNTKLQQKLDEIHEQGLSESATRLKRTLVPAMYAPSSIVSSCRQQTRCPKKRYQQLHQLPYSVEWQQWEVSHKRPATTLLWITDKRRANSSISVIPIKVVDEYAGTHVVLHSLYQSGEIMSPLPQNARTATTVIGEAMYQLLHHCPDLWPKYKPEAKQANSLHHLAEQFAGLLDAYCIFRPSEERRKVYWVIDRLDTIFWKTYNSPQGISEGPPQSNGLSDKAERKQISRASVTLEDFLSRLNSMPHRQDETAGENHVGPERKWELKVLVSSHYEVDALRRSHGIEEEVEWPTGKWIDVVV